MQDISEEELKSILDSSNYRLFRLDNGTVVYCHDSNKRLAVQMDDGSGKFYVPKQKENP